MLHIKISIQKVLNVCAYSPRTCFVAADYWFLVFSVMLKSCLMQLYVGACHVVSAEIAVAMAAPVENPADCEVRGVIRFLQADEILGYLAGRNKLSRGIVLSQDNSLPHAARQTQASLREQFHWDIFEYPPYSPDLAPSDSSCFQK